MMKNITIIGVIFALFLCTPTQAQADDFKSIKIPVRKVMAQKELLDVFADAAASEGGVYLFQLVGGFLGAPPDTTETVRVILAQFQQHGQGTDDVTIAFSEPGYVFCKFDFIQTSGTGGRTLDVWSQPNGLRYVMWVKGTNYFKGRNWLEGYFLVALVKQDKYGHYSQTGTCQPNNAHLRSGGF